MKNVTVITTTVSVCLIVLVVCGVSSAKTTNNNPWNSIGMDTSKAETEKAERLALINMSEELGELNRQTTQLRDAVANQTGDNVNQNVSAVNDLAARLAKVEKKAGGLSNKAIKKKIAEAVKEFFPLVDAAAIAANSSDHKKLEELVTAITKKSEKMNSDLSQRLSEMDEDIKANAKDIKDLRQEVDDLKKQVASTGKTRERLERVDETIEIGGLSPDDINSLKSEIEEIKAVAAATQTMAKNASDSANAATAGVDGLTEKVTTLETKVQQLEAKDEKNRPSVLALEVIGGGMWFAPHVQSGTYTGVGVMISRSWFKLNANIDFGFGKNGDLGILIKASSYYAWKYFWLGLYAGMYSMGGFFDEIFGYTAGLSARLDFPIGGKKYAKWNWGLEGWIGPAYQAEKVAQDPPDGAADGAVYDKTGIERRFRPVVGGIRLYLRFGII